MSLSNDTDASHDIAVAIGECRGEDDDEDITLSAIMTKQIDASWAAGDDAGGLSSTITIANTTWYHVHAIMVGGSADVGFDTSITAANLVTDHSATAYRRIGSVLTDGSANIIAFKQISDHFFWVTPVVDYSLADPGTSAVTTTLTVPTGLEVQAIIYPSMRPNSQGVESGVTEWNYTAIYHPDLTGSAASSGLASQSVFIETATTNGGGGGANSVPLFTNTSAQIKHISNGDVRQVAIGTAGWVDDRGKNG
jgi:hypothetical protein